MKSKKPTIKRAPNAPKPVQTVSKTVDLSVTLPVELTNKVWVTFYLGSFKIDEVEYEYHTTGTALVINGPDIPTLHIPFDTLLWNAVAMGREKTDAP